MPNYKKIILYRDSRLPEEGWLQSCFYCYQITGSTILYKTIKKTRYLYDIEVYLCRHCQIEFTLRKYKQDTFNDKCNKYIENLILI
jgi:hypothetical protein